LIFGVQEVESSMVS